MKGEKRFLLLVGGFFFLLAVGAEFIANENPIVYSYDDNWKCGVCADWIGKTQKPIPDSAKTILPPVIGFDANTLSKESLYLQPPLSHEKTGTHWLGTDSQSRDVLAGIIYGTRYALFIGVISVFFSLIIGGLLGILAAYYGDTRLRISPWVGLFILVLIFTMSYMMYFNIISSVLGGSLLLILLSSILLLGNTHKGVKVPINQFVTKSIELFDSLPALFVLLAWAATVENWTIGSMSLLIAFFRWPTFARLIRAEMTPWTNSAWVKSLRDLKMSDYWIISSQLLNLVVVPISIHAAFAVASAVSIEATLTFLGFGLGVETQSWGRLLSDARQYFQAWWLVVFPGLFLFLFLWWTNEVAQYIQRKTKKFSP